MVLGDLHVSTDSKKVFFDLGRPQVESSVDIANEGCASDSNKTMRMLNPNAEQLVMASLQHCAPCGMKAVSSNAYRGMVIVDMSQEITATNMGFDPSKHVVELINASNNGVKTQLEGCLPEGLPLQVTRVGVYIPRAKAA